METKKTKQSGSGLLRKIAIGTGKTLIGAGLVVGLANLTSEQTSKTGTYLGNDVTPEGKVSLFKPLGATDSMNNYSVEDGQGLEKGQAYTAFETHYFGGLSKKTDSIVKYKTH